MRFRQKKDNEQEQPPMPLGDPAGASELDGLRDAAQSFLDAGDQAIDNAISEGNSSAFLIASRQSGGQ